MSSPTSTIRLDARALLAAKQQATYLTNKVKTAYANGELATPQDIENRFNIQLDPLAPNKSWSPAGRACPLQQITLDYICREFVNQTEQRLRQAEEELAAAPVQRKLYVQSDPAKRWRFTNNPKRVSYQEQDPVIREIVSCLFEKNQQAVLCPGGTGAGKTTLGAAVIDEAIHKYNYHQFTFNGIPLPIKSPILWFTVPNAEVQTRRELVESGLGAYLDANIITVLGYNHLGTTLGELTYCSKTVTADPFDEAKPPVTTYQWHPQSVARLVLLDEFHKTKNEDAGVTQRLRALIKACKNYPIPNLNTRYLALTATPFEKVADSRFFVTMAGIKFNGIEINDENFNTQFANIIAKGDPKAVNAAAMRRLYNAVQTHVVEIPYVPWPFKAINSCKYYDFLREEDRQQYREAYDKHLERLEALGRDQPLGPGAIQGSLTVFRKEVEPIRMEQIVDEMYAAVQTKEKVAACATVFTGSILKALDILTNKYHVPRSAISIVWGGRENVQPDPVLDDFQLGNYLAEISQQPDGITPKQRRFIEKQMAWREDRLLFGDASDQAQLIRYARLRALGLIGTQTKTKRQEEIDRFQTGKSQYLFYTAASGGTGLSLPDHTRGITLPREVWSSPIYSGQEFTQVLGRCPRRNSISNTRQFVCGMRGTIESEHVIPILDNKLQAAGEFVSRKTDLTRALAELFLKSPDTFKKTTFADGKIRSAEQAAVDAVSNEETQVHTSDVTEEDEDDDGQN